MLIGVEQGQPRPSQDQGTNDEMKRNLALKKNVCPRD